MAVRQAILDDAVAAGDAPFVVALTGDRSGLTWAGAAGQAREDHAAGPRTVFRIFSMSKAIGSTAAMILFDRGILSPDTPVADVLPQFGELKVLEGFDESGPRLRAPATVCTVGHLATHTSGLGYEFWNADLARWMELAGHPTIMSGLNRSLAYPLLFDPGTRWGYGIGIDWLGRVVEAVDGRPIDRFCTEEIFEPLDMKDTTFEVTEDQQTRLADVFARKEDGTLRRTKLAPPSMPEFYGLGHCLYSSASDYMIFLRMYLGHGQLEGTRILSSNLVGEMLGNRIGDLTAGPMRTVLPHVSADFELFPGRRKTHSMAFMRFEDDVPGMRSAGSQGWAGVLNSHYWFDPTRDLAGVVMTQLRPFADPRFMAVFDRFERAAYAA